MSPTCSASDIHLAQVACLVQRDRQTFDGWQIRQSDQKIAIVVALKAIIYSSARPIRRHVKTSYPGFVFDISPDDQVGGEIERAQVDGDFAGETLHAT